MAAHTAVELVRHGLIVVACPSLTLIAQTLTVWATGGVPDEVLAVCSDATVGDSAVRAADLSCPATTDPGLVAGWLARTIGAKRRLLLVTHHSAGVAGQGLLAARVVADLLIVDEAHRSAGRGHKLASALHHDETFPARRRLYVTATPRLFRGAGYGYGPGGVDGRPCGVRPPSVQLCVRRRDPRWLVGGLPHRGHRGR
jgi:predicted helicase